MRILMNTFGSAGDTLPFIAIGRALKARGHEVIVLANEDFRGSVESAGLRFLANGTSDQMRELTGNPDLWHPQRGLQLVLRKGVAPTMRLQFDLLRGFVVPGQTVVVSGVLALGARLLREKLGRAADVPLVTLHLAPSAFFSVHRAPKYPGLSLPSFTPKFVKAALFRMADKKVDKWIGPDLDALRKHLGLAPVRGIFRGWAHSPDELLCLWPDWFAAPQPDWPPFTSRVGFPLYDDAEYRPLGSELEAWLDDGHPPVAFSAGSANVTPRDFFAAGVRAARSLGRRALLVSTVPEVGSLAGGDVFHAFYVPFSRVLPRCAAFVTHGGIGSVAQGLAAGVPQLVTPRAYDQFDNASRVTDLGAGLMLPARQWGARRADEALGKLLTSTTIPAAARKARQEQGYGDPIGASCKVIETAHVRGA
ncbi:MAG TPA: nucleotide disphospho-sugar-binding domain-containing protein [Planctomycetota bacterium]|nr:nucleotide disphospho-sugar-binding domain-containing protein [Planctomycetota bacterium]